MVYAHASALPARAFPDATGALESGTRLEEFEIERVLCDSGYGVVYLARDHALDLTVALKEYLPATLAVHGAGVQVELREPAHGDAFERGRRAFIEEARILARCDHPSLLRVHRIWEANGTAYRVMPHYPGQSLLAVRRAMREPPDEASLRALLDELLGALEALHSAGHVHGDVSAANILLLPDDRPVLMDFGAVARAIISERTQHLMHEFDPGSAGHRAGPSSVPPQAWSDLHALEAVVQFCINGDSPASAGAPNVTALREPWAGVPRRAQVRVGGVRYSSSFLETLTVMRNVRPEDALRSAAQFRALLRSHGAQVTGRIEPVLNPGLTTTRSLGTSEPELSHIDPLDDLSHAMAAIAKQARTQHTVAMDPAPRHAALSSRGPRPRLARLATWGGAALVLLAFGAAGWKLSDQLAMDKTPVRLAAFDRPDAVTAAAANPALGNRGDPPMTLPDTVAASVAAQQVGARPATGAVSERAAVPAKTEKPTPGLRPAVRAPISPREECGARTEFALYRCMQTQCAQALWAGHAQCVRLRLRDEVE